MRMLTALRSFASATSAGVPTAGRSLSKTGPRPYCFLTQDRSLSLRPVFLFLMFAFKMKMFAVVLRLLVLVGLCVGLVRAHPACAPLPDVGLVVVPEVGLRLTGRNQADFEFGKINSLDRPQVEHRFTFRNEAETPLVITNLETTCRCTTATVEEIAGKPAAVDAFVHYLLPGQEMVVKLIVNLVRQPFGPMSHGAALLVSGNESPVARIHIIGEMEVPLTVSSSDMDFGQMKRGDNQSQPLTITLDRRLLSGDTFPSLVIQSGSGPADKMGDFLKIVPQARRSAPQETAYEITVQPKQTGPFSVRLVFASITPADYHGTIPYERAMEIFRGMQIDVRGEVMGK
jgi:Protein of unknown function (DUF1573)